MNLLMQGSERNNFNTKFILKEEIFEGEKHMKYETVKEKKNSLMPLHKEMRKKNKRISLVFSLVIWKQVPFNLYDAPKNAKIKGLQIR